MATIPFLNNTSFSAKVTFTGDVEIARPNGATGVLLIKGGKNVVSAVGEINSELNFGSNDGSIPDRIGGSIKSVTEFANGARVGMAFHTANQSVSPVLQEAMRINYEGYIGIGTDDPDHVLHVKDISDTVTLLQLESGYNNPSGNKSIHWSDATDNVARISVDYTAPMSKMRFGSLYNSGYKTGDVMVIQGDGNVGIGTTSPDRKLVLDGELGTPALEIKKNTDRIVYLGTGSSAAVDDAPLLHLMDQNVIKVNLSTVGDSYLNGGNVGIGTDNPLAKLDVEETTSDVAGEMRLAGKLASDDLPFGKISFANTSAANTQTNDILAYIAGEKTGSSNKGELTFATSDSASPIERMRINSAGHVNIKGTNTKLSWERTSDGASDVVFLTKTDSLGSNGTAKLQGYDGITFHTSGPETERMRIDVNGDFDFKTGNATFGGNVITDGIFKVDSAPDNNILEVTQSGRKMALKTSFAGDTVGSFWAFRVSNGNVNGSTTDALIVKPQQATFAGDVTTNGQLVVNTFLKLGDGGNGYFYSDTDGRTAFTSGDFYIQDGVANYYNYATQQFHGNASGDNHYFRSNALSGTNWGINSSGNATFTGRVGIGATGLYTTTTDLNLSGKGVSFKNDINGASNNWSYIYNTATASQSNLVFATGFSLTALTLSHSGNAAFAGNVQLGGETPTLNFLKTSAGDVLGNIKVESDTGTGGKFTIQTKRNGNTPVNALVIDEGQRIGIGTDSPVPKFHIVLDDSTGGTANGATIEQKGLGDATMSFLLSGGQRWKMGADNSDGNKFKLSGGNNLNSNTVLTVNGSLDVGIGETNPTAKLQVVGLSEYTGNMDAKANNLTAGAFYRTGDFLKVVH